MRAKYNLASVLAVGLIMLGGYAAFAEDIDVQKEKRAFGKASDQDRMNVARRLAGAGKQGTHALLDLAENTKDPAARYKAFVALVESVKDTTNQDEESLSRLEKLAAQPDKETVVPAVRALAHFKNNPKTRAAIKKAIEAQQDDHARAVMLSSLMFNTNRDKAELPFIKEYFLHDKSEYVRVMSAGYIGSLGDKSGVALCREILEREPKPEIEMMQMRATQAAGEIGDPQLLPILRKIGADSKYGFARPHALTAINDIELGLRKTKAEKLEYLKKALSDRNSARWAAMTLRNMKDDREAKTLLDWAYQQKDIAPYM